MVPSEGAIYCKENGYTNLLAVSFVCFRASRLAVTMRRGRNEGEVAILRKTTKGNVK